jgi:hypothetical protein
VRHAPDGTVASQARVTAQAEARMGSIVNFLRP